MRIVLSLITCLLFTNDVVTKHYSFSDATGVNTIHFQFTNTLIHKTFNPGAPSYIKMTHHNGKSNKDTNVLILDSCNYHMTQMQFYPNSVKTFDLNNDGVMEFIFIYGVAGHLYEESPISYCILSNGKLHKVALTKKYTDEAGAEILLNSLDDFKKLLPEVYNTKAVEEYNRLKAICLSAQ